MKKQVTITARIENGAAIVQNDLGSSWRFDVKDDMLDLTASATLATIITSMLTATITAQLLHTSEKKIRYRLEVLTGAEAR